MGAAGVLDVQLRRILVHQGVGLKVILVESEQGLAGIMQGDWIFEKDADRFRQEFIVASKSVSTRGSLRAGGTV